MQLLLSKMLRMTAKCAGCAVGEGFLSVERDTAIYIAECGLCVMPACFLLRAILPISFMYDKLRILGRCVCFFACRQDDFDFVGSLKIIRKTGRVRKTLPRYLYRHPYPASDKQEKGWR